MKHELPFFLIVPLLAAVMLASAAFPLAALADDATPPPAAGTSDESSAPAATAIVPTPTPTWIAPTPQEAAPSLAPEALAAPSDLSALPADTSVVVLDSDGASLPLATNEAADIIASGDPIWCPTGYLPGAPECTAAVATITDLILALGSESGAGTIYFMPTYTAPDALLNHIDPSLVNLTDLTLQGGWNGGLGAGFGLSGVTEFTVPVSILNWTGDITLNDLLISGTSTDGLYVTTNGDIQLNRVESRSHGGRGAYLDNTSGGSGVEVRVDNSSFHDNEFGLVIYSLGDVSLAFVDANYNLDSGTYINSDEDVNVDDSNFRFNGLYGLGILAADDVSLAQVVARENDSDGTWVIAGGRVTVDDSIFRDNSDDGLDIFAEDNITLTSVTSFGNDASGLLLVSEADATLSHINTYGNENDGAYVQSLSSDITMLCPQFNYNGLFGLEADLPGTLTLDGATFKENGSGDYDITGGGTLLQRPEDECILATPAVRPTVTVAPIREVHTINVVDGTLYTLDCDLYIGTELVLPNGDKVTLPCPITGEASLSAVESDELPQVLEDGQTFVSALDVLVSPTLDGVITVAFKLQPDQTGAGLSILRWDDTEWTELSGIRTAEDFLEARSGQDGVFALVSE